MGNTASRHSFRSRWQLSESAESDVIEEHQQLTLLGGISESTLPWKFPRRTRGSWDALRGA
jgi:hypothetical protein